MLVLFISMHIWVPDHIQFFEKITIDQLVLFFLYCENEDAAINDLESPLKQFSLKLEGPMEAE